MEVRFIRLSGSPFAVAFEMGSRVAQAVLCLTVAKNGLYLTDFCNKLTFFLDHKLLSAGSRVAASVFAMHLGTTPGTS